MSVHNYLEKGAGRVRPKGDKEMNPIQLMMKTATYDFLDTEQNYLTKDKQGPLTKKFSLTTGGSYPPTLKDYRRFLVSQVNDPKLGDSAKEVLSALDNVSKKDSGLLSSVSLMTDNGESFFQPATTGSYIRATQDDPATLAHEVRHRVYGERVVDDVDRDGRLTRRGRNRRWDVFDRRMNEKTQKAYKSVPFFKRVIADIKGEELPQVKHSFKRHEYLASLIPLRANITNEADANRGAINAILGKRSLDAATPREKKQILGSLVGMTSYYEGDPRSSYSKHTKLQQQSKPVDTKYPEFKLNPFDSEGNAWKKMNRQQRMNYIKQIKLNRRHLEANMPQGKRMGKLYMKGMMKALRSRL